MARPRWSCVVACGVVAACAAWRPPQPSSAPAAVTFTLGDEKTLTALYSYPNGGTPETLAQTVERYLNASLRRDGFSTARGRVTQTSAGYQALVDGSEPGLERYAERLPAFLANGKVAQAVSADLERQGAWRSEWRMFLPLGLALVSQRSVQLLHFPPDDSLKSQDYLASATSRRWEGLLQLNGVGKSDTPLYEAIVDISPVAAPARSGDGLPTRQYSDYAKAQLRLLLGASDAGEYTRPLVAYGCPVREWLTDNYHPVPMEPGAPAAVGGRQRPLEAPARSCQSDLHVLDVAHVVVVEGRRTPLLVANHPSYIWSAGSGARFSIMLEDLAAACWQAGMASAPDAPPGKVIADCRASWQARPQDVCVQVEVDVCGRQPEEARELCAPAPTHPPDCPERPAREVRP